MKQGPVPRGAGGTNNVARERKMPPPRSPAALILYYIKTQRHSPTVPWLRAGVPFCASGSFRRCSGFLRLKRCVALIFLRVHGPTGRPSFASRLFSSHVPCKTSARSRAAAVCRYRSKPQAIPRGHGAQKSIYNNVVTYIAMGVIRRSRAIGHFPPARRCVPFHVAVLQ